MGKHKKKGAGGKRKGAGRPKIEDPAIHLDIYPRSSAVKKAGGKEKAIQIATEAIENFELPKNN